LRGGDYPENGNAKLPVGDLSEINDFEALTQRELAAVVCSPTCKDEFPTAACNKLADRVAALSHI
jgi:hypothetical protein